MIRLIPRLSRRRVVLTGVLLVIAAVGLVFAWNPVMNWRRTQSRRAWLEHGEAEIRRQLQAGRPARATPGGDHWIADNVALFDQGWAAWRLHSSHWDDTEGSWPGLGDITILIDDQGRVSYSRSHFCDGTLRWGLGPSDTSLPRPKDRDAFLALFRPGTWTEDRSAIEAAMPRFSPAPKASP